MLNWALRWDRCRTSLAVIWHESLHLALSACTRYHRDFPLNWIWVRCYPAVGAKSSPTSSLFHSLSKRARQWSIFPSLNNLSLFRSSVPEPHFLCHRWTALRLNISLVAFTGPVQNRVENTSGFAVGTLPSKSVPSSFDWARGDHKYRYEKRRLVSE